MGASSANGSRAATGNQESYDRHTIEIRHTYGVNLAYGVSCPALLIQEPPGAATGHSGPVIVRNTFFWQKMLDSKGPALFESELGLRILRSKSMTTLLRPFASARERWFAFVLV